MCQLKYDIVQLVRDKKGVIEYIKETSRNFVPTIGMKFIQDCCDYIVTEIYYNEIEDRFYVYLEEG